MLSKRVERIVVLSEKIVTGGVLFSLTQDQEEVRGDRINA